ncbi:Hypothetical protein FKW44_014195 [Caligus rogercresseyi]|uniref:Uncharacterized protein n=1 Tax=Caligus rogercresseyi TaxID=217165 RepID=A0A7T8GZ68_CALRO|nr:Hypothetical protein FKW44_014195 [Caligus rogercresseyi]
MKRNVRRQRTNAYNAPALPATRGDLVIPPELTLQNLIKSSSFTLIRVEII